MAAITKIDLSGKELELVCNTEWILTKHTIIQKVYDLFGNTLPAMEAVINEKKGQLPAEVFLTGAKISRGENYKLLPYLMLDYPRCFGKNDSLAIRTFFWWGNFFSVSLQLSGSHRQQYVSNISRHFKMFAQNGYYICTADDPWEHHFERENYSAVNALDEKGFENILQQQPFIKIAKPLPLRQWQAAPDFIVSTFKELAGLLQNNQAPRR